MTATATPPMDAEQTLAEFDAANAGAKRPWGVPRDLWRAYGPNYPGGFRRWLLRESERQRRSKPPEPTTGPSVVINLRSYLEENRLEETAEELRRRVDASRAHVAQLGQRLAS